MKIKTTSAHWGSYYPKVKNKKLISLEPYEKDENPSLISEGMIDAVNDKLRIQNPCVRAGWYHDYLNESENNNIASAHEISINSSFPLFSLALSKASLLFPFSFK